MFFNLQEFNWRLSEINQLTSIKFAHCMLTDKDTYTQLTPFCKCRDFFNDLILKNQLNINFNIYGFKYLKDIKQRDEDHTILALFIPDKKEYNNFLNNILIYLPEIEKTNEIKPYELVFPTNLKSYIIIKADKYWQSHTLLLSFFTFLLRCFCYPIEHKNNFYINILNSEYKDKQLNREINYINSLEIKKLLFFQNNLKQLIPENYKQSPYGESIFIFHDQSGFYNFLHHDNINRIISCNKDLKKHFIELYNSSCPVDVNPVTQS
jgi:hypothetical protein